MLCARKKKSVPGLVISRFFGLLVLFLIVWAFNRFDDGICGSPMHIITLFLNQNLVLLILISLIFLVGDVFGVLPFPVNLPAPIFNATGAVFVVAFIFRVFGLIQDLTLENAFDAFKPLAVLIYFLVFLIVLVVGYITIFIDLFRCDEDVCKQDRWGKWKKHKEEEPAPSSTVSTEAKDNPSWEAVGQQFRATMYEAFLAARKSMKEEREKNK